MDTDNASDIPLNPIGAPSEHNESMTIRSHSWVAEIAALLCSTAALIALIILLAKEDNKPLDDWKAPFSINTIASILSVLFRTPLAFAVGSCLGQGKWSWFSKRSGPVAIFAAIDKASRGPMGSLELLWRLKARHWVSFGALTTVGLVAVDPFLQAIIDYRGQLDLGDNSDVPLFGRASRLDVGSLNYLRMAQYAYHGVWDIIWCSTSIPNIAMSTSSIMGFVNSSTSSSARPPLVTCQTGNCTWEAYSTLAFCSSCFDVSTHLKKHNHRAGVFCDADGGLLVTNITNYTIPYGASDAYCWGENGIGDGKRRNFCGNKTVAGQTLVHPNDTYNLQEWDTLLAAFVLLHPTESYFNREKPWENDIMTATECGLRLCIKVFQPKVTNGETHEILLSDAFERVPESFQPTAGSSRSNKTIEKWINNDFGSSLASRVSMDGDCRMLQRTDLQLRIPSDVITPNEVQLTFNVTQASITTIIDEIISGKSRRIFDALNESTSLVTSFENAAQLMSYQIRELDGTIVPGVAHKWTIYIQTRWLFMVFPIVVFILGSVFSVTVMLGSGSGKTRTMKANMLESMLHGLDEETSTQLRNSNVKDKMEKHVFVRLRDGPEGLRLRQPGTDHYDSNGIPQAP